MTFGRIGKFFSGIQGKLVGLYLALTMVSLATITFLFYRTAEGVLLHAVKSHLQTKQQVAKVHATGIYTELARLRDDLGPQLRWFLTQEHQISSDSRSTARRRSPATGRNSSRRASPPSRSRSRSKIRRRTRGSPCS